MFKRLFLVLLSLVILGLAGPVMAQSDPDLVGWWKFDEGAGTTAQDSSGYGNNGTLNGDPQWAEGRFRGALEFDGAGDYVDCGSDPSLDLTTWTITFWLNAAENKNYNGFVIKGVDAAENYEVLGFADGSFHFPITLDNGSRTFVNTATGVIVAGEWSHFAYCYDSADGRRLYKDGDLVFDDEESGTPQPSSEPLIIGNERPLDRYVNGTMDDVRIYSRILTAEELADVMLGKGPNSTLAADPSPEDGTTDVPLDTVLAWEAGEFAATHDVYLGAIFEDVNEASRTDDKGVLLSQGQTALFCDPGGAFEYGQTYYWRVDEVNAAPDNTIFKGETWSFTVEPLAYPIAGVTATTNAAYEPGASPDNTINSSGLNADDQHSIKSTDMFLGNPVGDEPVYLQYEFDGVYKLHQMLVWNYNVQFELLLGFGIQNATVEYSENGTDWMSIGEVDLNQATAVSTYTANTTIDFGGVAARYIKLTVNSGFGVMGQYGLSEVRFLYIPAQARQPEPADGAADVDVTAMLTWRAGRDSISHEVAFGTDPDALSPVGTVEIPSFDPGELDLEATYYWQVTEVQEAESWTGHIWSFATQDYLVIDDFESYTDDEGSRIYESWEDGYVNETGSTVGYFEEPFAEQTIVHGGGQSMPLFYDNAGAVSEADLALSQNWTTNGIESLSVYFYGDADNSEAQLYVKIDGTKVVYEGPAAALTEPSWHLWNIDLAATGANLNNVSQLTIGLEGAGSGVLYIDDIRLYAKVIGYVKFPDVTAPGDTVVGVPDDGDWPDAETPDLAIDNDTATKFLHFKGFSEPTGIQVTPAVGATIVTGVAFTTANDAAERDPVAFEFYGSNDGIDGPYTLITGGEIADFAQATAWPRFTKNETPITFDNGVAYTHYQLLFTGVRDAAGANSMQIAEIELLGVLAP